MTIYKSCSDICNQAKIKLDGKYSTVTLFLLLYYALSINMNTILASLAATLTESISSLLGRDDLLFANILLYLLGIGISVLVGVIRAGLALYFLSLVCGGEYNSFQLFYGFQNDFPKTITLSLVVTLIQEICMLPYQYVTYRQLYMKEILWGPILGTYLMGAVLFTLAIMSFSQVFYLLLDFPELSARELLRKSARLMKGHKRRYLMLQIRFLPLMLLGILSFGIGMIWILPYMNTATTIFFLDLMNPGQQDVRLK